VKDKMIATLKKGNGSEGGNGGGGLPDAADAAVGSSVAELSAEVDALRQERELLREEAQRAKLAAEGLRCDVEDLEAQMQSGERNLSQDNAARREASQQRDLWLRDKSELSQRLAQAEAELDALRRQSAPQLLRSGAGTSVASGGQDGGELEARIRSLTESLIQKQTALESSNAEKASLRLMVEQLESRLSERTHHATSLAQESGLSSRSSQAPSLIISAFTCRIRPMQGLHMKRAVNTLDKAGVKLGVFLRRYPMARMLFLAYIGLLHLWVLLVLLTYQPEMHQRANASTAMAICQDPVSAVRRSQLLFDDGLCRQFNDSSASSASHQFQEIFPPLADIDIGARTETTAAVAAEARASTPRTPSANGGNIGIELLLSAGSELVAASAEFCLCANCGLADPFDTFKCAQCAISWNPARPCLPTSLCTGHERYQKKRPKMTAPPAGAAVAARTPPRPAIRSSKPAPSQPARKLFQHSRSRPSRRCSRKLAAFPSVTLGPSEQLSRACLQCTAWTAGVVAQNEHGKRTAIIRFRLFSTGAVVSGGPTCYKCLLCPANEPPDSHISRFSHETSPACVDDCSRLADGPPPGQELPYLRVRLCPMRPGESHLALLIVALAEESPQPIWPAAACNWPLLGRISACRTASISAWLLSAVVPCRSSVYLTCLLCPTRLRFASELPPHLNAAHRRPCPLCQKPILLPDAWRRHLQTVCITRCSLCDRCFPSEAQLRRHRDADHSTHTLPPPVKRRRRSIVDFGAAATQTRDTRRRPSAVVLHVWRRIHQLVGAEVASFGVPPASSWQ
uniref:C2H2-type domain-containing protein n=1 Tax=Macrostomum lignano TaxID=282301 RepID=A0A1I8JME9_9PLAT